MKNKLAVLMCGMLLFMCVMPVIQSTIMVEPFEKKDLPFDVMLNICFITQKNKVIPVHSSIGLLTMSLLNFLDIRSFSIYETPDTPEYLYASMEVTNFQYSEYRSTYAIYWYYKGIQYAAYTNTHSLGEVVSSSCGYWGETSTDFNYTIIEGDILEEQNTITWKIPKNLIGDPTYGAVLQNIHAISSLNYQKDCEAPMQIRLAIDFAEPLPGFEYTYTLQL